jgi:hypothetical protein
MKHVVLYFLALVPLLCHADFKDGGNAYINGDYEAAANEFIPLAERGDHRAMYALGSMYAAGQGVEKNLKKAFELFKEAAQNGRADAMYKLGVMYEEGVGTKKSTKKAIRYYQKSAKLGYPLGQYHLGLMYLNGSAVKQNTINAYAWMVVAAHQFIYEYAGKNLSDDKKQYKNKKYRLILVQQKQKDNLLDKIISHLQNIRAEISPNDIEKIKQKVIKHSKYRWKHQATKFKNIEITSDIESLFLPETLQ